MTSPSALRAALGALAGLVLAASVWVPATADPQPPGPTEGGEPDTGTEVIARAGRILAGTADPAEAGRADATLALRDLFLARPTLGFIEGIQADVLLARPTDGREDRAGDGYRHPDRRLCGDRLCVHHVTRGADAPARADWPRRTLRVLERVWDLEVGRLGFRPPPRDGRRGGDGRFDVYLADLGDRGLFGYCTPERRVRGERFAASGYCVLDDDFARRQYGAPPLASLRVTAAHEFLHAIQFGYDFHEDPWLLESTATWVEERFADGADDNRRYLRYGSVRRPGVALDRFSNAGYAHYGAWAFWERLSRRVGADVVRAVWERADARGDAPDDYSVVALDRVLAARGGLRAALTSYAVANLAPAAAYAEGDAWPSAQITTTGRVRARGTERRVRVDHLAAAHLVLRPAGRAGGRLRVSVDGPHRRSAPAAVVQVRRADGRTSRHRVRLDRTGAGHLVVGFGAARVRSVVVTLVNGSTRYRCDAGTTYACAGRPRDDDRRFRVTARLLPR